jgi:hypothetical protein
MPGTKYTEKTKNKNTENTENTENTYTTPTYMSPTGSPNNNSTPSSSSASSSSSLPSRKYEIKKYYTSPLSAITLESGEEIIVSELGKIGHLNYKLSNTQKAKLPIVQLPGLPYAHIILMRSGSIRPNYFYTIDPYKGNGAFGFTLEALKIIEHDRVRRINKQWNNYFNRTTRSGGKRRYKKNKRGKRKTRRA